MSEKMSVVIIYSNARKESTYHCVKIFKEAVQKEIDVDYIEFTLPNDMPHICRGCFACIEKGEEQCPHSNVVQPIVKAILDADGIILTSPVYSLDASCAIKSLFDHMCYLWISHRPNKKMFHKTAMVITTAAGAGVKTSIKTMKKSPSYWGVRRIYHFGIAAKASRWEHVSNKTRIRIEVSLTKKAKQFISAIKNKDKGKQRLLLRFMFPLMGKMIGGYEDDGLLYKDKEYWAQNGWLDGGKPY
jgi:multimeric flavodoxin WrbA